MAIAKKAVGMDAIGNWGKDTKGPSLAQIKNAVKPAPKVNPVKKPVKKPVPKKKVFNQAAYTKTAKKVFGL